MLDGDSQLALAATLKNINTGSIPYRGLKDRTLTGSCRGVYPESVVYKSKSRIQYMKRAKDFKPGQSPSRKVLMSVGAMA